MMTRTVLCLTLLCSPFAQATEEGNPLIDAEGYRAAVEAATAARELRRVDEQEFLRLAALPDSVVLDARSASAYALRHVRGAVHLSYTDFTAEALAALIPTPETRVLIYCNNNFLGSPAAFATKAPAASLNLATFAALHAYGYRQVYELAPLRDIGESQLPFAGSETEEG